MYLPLVASGKSLGLLALRPRQPDHPLEPAQRHLLETFATQLAIALERTAFAAQAETARREAETEQIRSSLLSCVSHDLRTPLAAIVGAGTALADEFDWPYVRENLPRMIARTREGVQRVANIVSTLRGLARTSPPKMETAGIPELLEGALEMLRGRLPSMGGCLPARSDQSKRPSPYTSALVVTGSPRACSGAM